MNDDEARDTNPDANNWRVLQRAALIDVVVSSIANISDKSRDSQIKNYHTSRAESEYNWEYEGSVHVRIEQHALSKLDDRPLPLTPGSTRSIQELKNSRKIVICCGFEETCRDVWVEDL